MFAGVILILFCPSAMWAQDHPQTLGAGAATAKRDTGAPSRSIESQPADTLPRKYVDLWNTGDFNSMKSFFSPFYMTSHGSRVVVNEAMLKKVITSWRQSMPDLKFQIKDTIIQGDQVAMRLTFTGTYKSQLFPFTSAPADSHPPKTIRGTEMLFFQLKDGKIVEIWEEYDEMVMRVQMGGVWGVPRKATPSSRPAPNPALPTAKP